MNKRFLQVEGHNDLVRDTESNAIVNKNRGAYILAKQRAEVKAAVDIAFSRVINNLLTFILSKALGFD